MKIYLLSKPLLVKNFDKFFVLRLVGKYGARWWNKNVEKEGRDEIPRKHPGPVRNESNGEEFTKFNRRRKLLGLIS